MELLSGHKKIITKSEISLNSGTLNRGFTVYLLQLFKQVSFVLVCGSEGETVMTKEEICLASFSFCCYDSGVATTIMQAYDRE
jgi:hypothetical protein